MFSLSRSESHQQKKKNETKKIQGTELIRNYHNHFFMVNVGIGERDT